MRCNLNSVDPAICLGSQDMCFLIREPGFTSHTLTLSRKLQLQCLLCFAYQKPRLFQFPALQPPVPICLWKSEGSALAHPGWGCSWGLCRAPGCCCGGAHLWGHLWGKKLFFFSCSKRTTPIFYPWAWLVTPNHQAAAAEHHQVLSTPPDLKFPVTSGFFPLAVGLNCDFSWAWPGPAASALPGPALLRAAACSCWAEP